MRLEGWNTSILKTERSPVISFQLDLYLSPRAKPCAQRYPAVAGSFIGTTAKSTALQRLCPVGEGLPPWLLVSGDGSLRDPELPSHRPPNF